MGLRTGWAIEWMVAAETVSGKIFYFNGEKSTHLGKLYPTEEEAKKVLVKKLRAHLRKCKKRLAELEGK